MDPSGRDQIPFEHDWSAWKWPDQSNTAERLTLLSIVCRQLHQETALIPFELNLFTFDGVHHLKAFIRSLKPVQCRSLRTVGTSATPWNNLAKSDIARLTGLREVYIAYEVHDEEKNNCRWKDDTMLGLDVARWAEMCTVKVVHNGMDTCDTCKGSIEESG